MTIQELRNSVDMSKYRLAKLIGVAYITVLNWERGIYKPSKDSTAKLKELFKVDKIDNA